MFLICRKTMRVAQEPRFAAVFHVHFYQPECGMRNVSHTSVLKVSNPSPLSLLAVLVLYFHQCLLLGVHP